MVRFCFRGGLWLAHDLKKCHRQPHLQGMSRAGCGDCGRTQRAGNATGGRWQSVRRRAQKLA